MTMLMSPPSTVNAVPATAVPAVTPATELAPVALSPLSLMMDAEAASDDALSAMLAILDDSFRVNRESGIDEALRFQAERVAEEKARIRARYGEAGRQALADAAATLGAWRQLAEQPTGAVA